MALERSRQNQKATDTLDRRHPRNVFLSTMTTTEKFHERADFEATTLYNEEGTAIEVRVHWLGRRGQEILREPAAVATFMAEHGL